MAVFGIVYGLVCFLVGHGVALLVSKIRRKPISHSLRTVLSAGLGSVPLLWGGLLLAFRPGVDGPGKAAEISVDLGAVIYGQIFLSGVISLITVSVMLFLKHEAEDR